MANEPRYASPASTASGIPVPALRNLPWRAKLACAFEPNLARAFELTQVYGVGPDADWDAFHELGNHPAVRDYMGRVMAWYASAGVGEPDSPDGTALSAAEVRGLFGPARPGSEGPAPAAAD
jgi:hypothetical protein